jgi:hypothetical protein
MYGQDGTNLMPPYPQGWPQNYKIAAYLNAVDPFVDTRVFFGFLAYATDGSTPAILAIRGTYDFVEWVNNVDVWPEPFPPIPGSYVAAGFSYLYNTIGWKTPDTEAFDVLSAVQGQTGVILAGHSLGGAIASMLMAGWISALPILNSGLTIATAASPAVGDSTFASGFNSLVASSYRYINELDSVAGSLDWIYTQVNGDGVPLGPSWDVWPSPVCEHSLETYLWLLVPGSCSQLGDCCFSDLGRKQRLQTVVQARMARKRAATAGHQ